ncbi:DUF4403 family protein [Vibrio fluvialis]|uniref:DUF4403 family protein n=1 Tax=Vibrio fluvialis TaxID=676 RepID=UPI0023AA0D56|nr:DUF4403 family protein [Vibrio fluvialis]MDE5179057.1 DUF4403 family protein [Vibrio fluvialis]
MKRVIPSLTALLILGGCTINPQPPQGQPPTASPDIEPSEVSVKADLNIRNLETIINNTVPRTFTATGKSAAEESPQSTPDDDLMTDADGAFQLREDMAVFQEDLYLAQLESELRSRDYAEKDIQDILAKNRSGFADGSGAYPYESMARGRVFNASYRAIARRGDINLDVGTNQLIAGMHFDTSLRADWHVCVGWWSGDKCRGISVRHHEDGKVAGNGDLSSKVGIEPDWTVTTKTAANIRLSEAWITLGPFRISVRSALTPVINQELRKVVRKLDADMGEKIDLRTPVEQAWPNITQVVRINDDPQVYVQIVPSELVWGGLTKADGDTARFGVGMKAKSQVILTDDVDPIELGPLPNVVTRSPTGQFALRIPVAVDLPYASDVVMKNLDGKVFKAKDNIDVRINDVDLSVNGEYVVAKIGFAADIEGRWWEFWRWFDTRGTMYLVAKPTFDEQSQEFGVRDLTFDLNTNQVLVDKAAYLLHDPLVRAIESQVKVSVKDKLDEFVTIANDSLKSVPIKDVGTFKANVSELKVKRIYTANNELIGLEVYLNGTSAIDLLDSLNRQE